MADGTLSDIFGGIGGVGGVFGLLKNTGFILLALFVLSICVWLVYSFGYKRKRWNLNVEIKIPRSDGKLITAEWGQGHYDNSKGVCFIKRKGKSQVPMKPFDPKVFLQGEKVLTVIQLAPNHYLPCLPESFLEVIDEETGIEASVIKIKSDLSESKSWKNSFERDSKQAFSIINLLKEYAPFIGVGIILFMNFAGFAILYSKVA